MSSIKLNSSGGGSVSLSAAPTSTDVTIQFPSGNSTVGQALVAGNTAGELDWESVKTDSSIQVFRSFKYENTFGNEETPLTTLPASPQIIDYRGWASGSSGQIDTHNAYDVSQGCWIASEFAYYSVTHVLAVSGNASNTVTRHVGNFIDHTDSTASLKERYSTYCELAPNIVDYGFTTNTVIVRMVPTDRLYFKAGRYSASAPTANDIIHGSDPFNAGYPIALQKTPASYVSIHKIRGF